MVGKIFLVFLNLHLTLAWPMRNLTQATTSSTNNNSAINISSSILGKRAGDALENPESKKPRFEVFSLTILCSKNLANKINNLNINSFQKLIFLADYKISQEHKKLILKELLPLIIEKLPEPTLNRLVIPLINKMNEAQDTTTTLHQIIRSDNTILNLHPWTIIKNLSFQYVTDNKDCDFIKLSRRQVGNIFIRNQGNLQEPSYTIKNQDLCTKIWSLKSSKETNDYLIVCLNINKNDSNNPRVLRVLSLKEAIEELKKISSESNISKHLKETLEESKKLNLPHDDIKKIINVINKIEAD